MSLLLVLGCVVTHGNALITATLQSIFSSRTHARMSQRPSGTYSTKIMALPFRPQTVRVDIEYDGRGRLSMRGFLTLTDTFHYRYDVYNGWTCDLGDVTRCELRRWHCSLDEFHYDSTRNEAQLTIRLPIRTIRLVLPNVS